MSRCSRAAVAIGLIALLAGCWHATIETGLDPAFPPRTIEKPWATSLIFGLVPPPIVETAQRCPDGVARVETQLSFLNQLVAFVTAYIYTPMAIKVTCAASPGTGAAAGAAVSIRSDATLEQKQREFGAAVRRAAESGQPVWVELQ